MKRAATIERIAVVALLGGLLGAARHAQACSTSTNFPRVDAPGDGAVDVPTNLVLWLGFDFELDGSGPPPERHVLRAPDASEVALDLHHAGIAGIRVLIPELELEPRTRYELLGCEASTCDRVLRTFTTGDGPDLEPPPAPIEEGRSVEIERAVGPCGGTFRWNELDIAFDGVLVVDLGLPEFDEGTFRGAADVISSEHDEHVIIEQDGVPLHDEHLPGRMGAFDRAGNFSGWQQLDPLELDGCGCTTGSRHPLALLAALALLARRRRRASN